MIVKPTALSSQKQPTPLENTTGNTPSTPRSNNVCGTKQKRKTLTSLETRSTIADLEKELNRLKTNDVILNFCDRNRIFILYRIVIFSYKKICIKFIIFTILIIEYI